MAIDRAIFAEECVRQGVYFGIEPHYLLAVAQLRSGISDENQGDLFGPFRLKQAEWDANRDDDEFDLDFTSAQIASPIRQCVVFGLMARRAAQDFAAVTLRAANAKELYVRQFPGADASGLQAALDNTAALIGPAAQAILDDPQSVSPINADQPMSATPPVLTSDPVLEKPAGGGEAGGTGGAGGTEGGNGAGGTGMLTLAMLQRHWKSPPAKAEIVQGMADTAGVLTRLGISTPLRMAHFMAQISAETGSGRHMVESLNYSAERMMQVFPKRFPTMASTVGFAHNERAFGNKVYNGRMGNRPGSDDGFNFRGRGCLQLTGRNNYDAVGKSLGIGLVEDPDLVNAPKNVLLVAATEFVKLGCLPECDRDNVVQVSARINLGHPTNSPEKINGLDERRRQLSVWKQEFGVA